LKDTLPHQAAFISREILKKCGGAFDDTLKLAADWKFFLEAVCKHNAKIVYLDKVISCYDYTGISSQKESQIKLMLEKDNILKTEYPFFYKDFGNLLAYNKLAKKYRMITSSRWVRFYISIRNLFNATKIDIHLL
jgi:hypothetical protein